MKKLFLKRSSTARCLEPFLCIPFFLLKKQLNSAASKIGDYFSLCWHGVGVAMKHEWMRNSWFTITLCLQMTNETWEAFIPLSRRIKTFNLTLSSCPRKVNRSSFLCYSAVVTFFIHHLTIADLNVHWSKYKILWNDVFWNTAMKVAAG